MNAALSGDCAVFCSAHLIIILVEAGQVNARGTLVRGQILLQLLDVHLHVQGMLV